MQLSELVEVGILSKRTGEGFPLFTEYYLTKLGETFLPIVNLLDAWGREHKTIFQRTLQGAFL